MAVKILARALRGIQGALALPGQQTAPAELELELPAQSVLDVGLYGAYGSALRPDLSDGWILWTPPNMTLVAGVFTATQIPFTTLVADLGIPAGQANNLMCFIEDLSVFVNTTALTDFDSLSVAVTYPQRSRIGSGAGTSVGIFANTNGTVMPVTATTGFAVRTGAVGLNHTSRCPYPPGAIIALNGAATANNVTLNFAFLIRIIPFGVPPQ